MKVSAILIVLIFIGHALLAQQPPIDDFLDDDDDFPPQNNFGQQPPTPAPKGPGAVGGDQGSTSLGNRSGFENGQGQPGTDLSGGNKGGGLVNRKKRNEPPQLKDISKNKKDLSTAPDRDITDENFPDLLESFDYRDADIGNIVQAISELTGKNFIVDPSVRGKITIIAPTRITVAEAYKAFLSALAINGLTVVPSGKFLKVKLAANAQRDSIETYAGAYAPNTDAMITRIIQLVHISAGEVNKSLGRILPSRNGEMTVYEPTNTIILSDFGANVDRAVKILRQLDVVGFEDQLEVVRIRYAKAGEMAKLIDQIINKGQKNSNNGPGAFTAGIPRFAPLGSNTQGSNNEGFSLVIPDDRTNSLIIVGNKAGIKKVKTLVAKLDFKLRPEDAGGVYVYYVVNGDAEKIATTLAGIAQASAQANNTPTGGAGGGSGGGGNIPGKTPTVFGGDVKITADKTTNSLVITASKQDYEVVQAILAKLDIPRDQVYVEGVILEMNVENTKKWGVSYYQFAGGGTAARAGFSGGSINSLQQLLDPKGDSGAVIGFGNGDNVDVSFGGQTVKIPSLAGLINFLSSITTVNILSTPQIMALDNEEAEIEVGDKVPVSSTTNSTTTGVQAGIERQDATIKLNIKPHISPGSNSMRLEIKQEIAGVSDKEVKASALAGSAVITTKRNAKTNIQVRDGDTIVLGGLMRDEESVSTVKIPLLGDIPILGWLFKSKKTENKKLNLLMFMTPKIVRNRDDSKRLLGNKLNERLDFIQKNAGGQDLHGGLAEKLNTMKKAESSQKPATGTETK